MHSLLAENGVIFVHLDDNEADYCKVMLDEIFGRKNFMNRVTVDARSPSAFSVVNPGMFVSSEYILYYAKDRTKLVEKVLRVERDVDYAYDKYIENYDDYFENWKFIPVSNAYIRQAKEIDNPISQIKDFNKFIINHSERICRLTAISDTGAGQKVIEAKKQSLIEPDKIIRIERKDLDDIYVLNGQQIAFYKKNIANIDGKKVPSTKLTDIWSDIAWEGIAKEGDVKFKRGKKPERLLKRCLEMSTVEGDFVLDSFLGSGTTAAVAHKMGRKYIGIEMGNHAYSHCKTRLDKIISGDDKSGISKVINYKGGGGYRFYELAPSLILKDDFDEEIINPEYNPDMLASAIALHEGYNYAPDKNIFWKQAKGNENSYLFVTTKHVTQNYIDSIYSTMKENEFLIIACKSFDKGIEKPYKNITIKKIPQMLLDSCEFSKDNYNLNIINPPIYDYEEDCENE